MLVDYKKLAIVIVIIILIIATAVIFYFLLRTDEGKRVREGERISGNIPGFPKTLPREGEIPEVAPPEREITGVPEARLKRITDFPVISPALTKDEKKVLFYKKDAGDLISYDIEKGEQERISRITIIGLLEALWSPQKDRAAVFYLDGDTKKGFLHRGTSSVTVLPPHIRSASWSPNGNSFAYAATGPNGLELTVSDSSGKNGNIVFEAPIRDAKIQWASSDVLLVETAPSGRAHGTLFRFSRTSEVFSKILSGFGVTSLVAPDADAILISSTDSSGKNLSLSLRDFSGKRLFETGIQTIADKCVWAAPVLVYCAIPKTIPVSAVMPDDYFAALFHTSDRIIKIDTKKEEIREVFGEGNFDIANLIITNKEDMIFFVDRRDGTLWGYKPTN